MLPGYTCLVLLFDTLSAVYISIFNQGLVGYIIWELEWREIGNRLRKAWMMSGQWWSVTDDCIMSVCI